MRVNVRDRVMDRVRGFVVTVRDRVRIRIRIRIQIRIRIRIRIRRYCVPWGGWALGQGYE